MEQFNVSMKYKLYVTSRELLEREIDEPNMKMAIVISNFKKIPGHSGPGC